MSPESSKGGSGSGRRRKSADDVGVNPRTLLITNFPASWPTDFQSLKLKVSELLQKFGNLCEPPIIYQPCKLGTSDVSLTAYASFEEEDAATKAIKCLHGTDNRSAHEERLANYAPPSDRQRYYVQIAECVPSKAIVDPDSNERESKIAKSEPPHFLHVGMPHLRAEPPPLHNLSLILQKQLAIIAQCDLPEKGSQSCKLLGPPSRAGSVGEERVTLVLDLDGTLVECRPPDNEPSESVAEAHTALKVQLEHSQHTVYFRPKAHVFLATVAHMFEVVIFTASLKSYADQVLDYLDPDGKLISARLYREHCLPVSCGPGQVVFIKDMSVLGRPIDRIILVDDSPISHIMTPDNGIIVSPWTAEEDRDDELLKLLVCLRECCEAAETGSITKHLAQKYGIKAFFAALRSFLGPQE